MAIVGLAAVNFSAVRADTSVAQLETGIFQQVFRLLLERASHEIETFRGGGGGGRFPGCPCG
jgi:hypothetical protein